MIATVRGRRSHQAALSVENGGRDMARALVKGDPLTAIIADANELVLGAFVCTAHAA